MVLKYDIKDIPAVKSDKGDKSRKHYILKKKLILWLDKNGKIPEYTYVKHDERIIKLSSGEGFDPDIAFIKLLKKHVWIEIETDPFNIFNKLLKLKYFYAFKPTYWPHKLIFGTIEPGNKKEYIKLYKSIKKSIPIKSIELYFIDKNISLVK